MSANAIDFTVIKPKFLFEIKGNEGGDLLEVYGFLGRDWKNPSHIIVKADGRLWIIALSELEQIMVTAGGPEDNLEAGSYIVWFSYIGNDEKLIEAFHKETENETSERERSEIRL